MRYLIDSDWIVDHLEEQPAAVFLLNSLRQEGIAISAITYMEVYEGIVRHPAPHEARSKFLNFVADVPVLFFSDAVAETGAQLRHRLRAQGKRINTRALDILNAAIALHYGLTLVTRNTADYLDIPGLQLYRGS